MKIYRTSTAILLALSIVIGTWSPMAVVTAESDPTPAVSELRMRDDLLYAGGELLARQDNGDTLRYLYDRLIDGLIDGETTVDVPLDGRTVTQKELDMVQEVAYAIIPPYYGQSTTQITVSISLYEEYVSGHFGAYASRQEEKAQTLQRVAELTHDLVGKSDYDKSRILFERLANVNLYEDTPNNQTAYGALVEGKSVCAGYARAYQLLMQAVDIPCLYITGFANNQSHAWNLVQLDGQWYYSDPTWGDSDNTLIGMTYYYLNRTYDYFSKSHIFRNEWLPKEPATDASYYNRNCVTGDDTLTVQQITELMRDHNPLILNVTGNRDTLYDLFWNHYETIARDIGLENWTQASCGPEGERFLVMEIQGEHRHDNQTLTLGPTCTVGGYTLRYCVTCTASHKEDLVDPLGHDNTRYPAKEATCIEQGWEAYDRCDRCGHSTQAKVWGACQMAACEVVEPTCTSDGYTMYVCTVCGRGHRGDVIAALGHEMGILPAKEATCLEMGWNAYEGCLRCGQGEREYVWGECQLVACEVVEPTCTSFGSVLYRCALCGYEYREILSYAEHQMIPCPAKEPTCREPGWDAYESCTVCGYSTKIYRYLPCQYEVTVVEPTCETQGYTHYRCTMCGGRYYDDYVDPIGHRPSEEWWHNQYGHGHPCLNNCDAIVDFTLHSDPCPVCGYSTTPTVLPGDADGNGKVNNRDLGRLQQHLNEWAVTIDSDACDLDGNGRVNNRDLGLLQRLLNE